MRTTAHDEDVGDHGVAEAFHPPEDLRPGPGKRAGTLAFFGLIAVGAWLVFARGGDDGSGRTPPGAPDGASSGTSALPAGTYRLPGLSTAVSVTLPEGWSAGDSIWGPAGRGIAAVSTGRPGASTSLAVFDLTRLLPYGRATNEPLSQPGDQDWFARWLDDYRSSVESRVRDRVIGRQLDWHPPAVLGWLLTHTERRPIDLSDEVSIGGRRGELVSFAFPGPPSPLFDVLEGTTIALRPDIRYTFWVPRGIERPGPQIMFGIARELGAVAGTAEWDVVRTLEFGP